MMSAEERAVEISLISTKLTPNELDRLVNVVNDARAEGVKEGAIGGWARGSDTERIRCEEKISAAYEQAIVDAAKVCEQRVERKGYRGAIYQARMNSKQCRIAILKLKCPVSEKALEGPPADLTVHSCTSSTEPDGVPVGEHSCNIETEGPGDK